LEVADAVEDNPDMPEGKYVGARVMVIWHKTLPWAVEQLLATLGRDKLQHLKIRSGEHLAAIIITAFLGRPPLELDADGGVDLVFDLDQMGSKRLDLRLGPGHTAAFEIKSMAGPYRKFDNKIDDAHRRGEDPTGAEVWVRARSANDVLADAAPLLARAAESLERKTAADVSRNAFLIVHPFDHLAVECLESQFIGRVLAPPPGAGFFDTVWVLWVPNHVTMWSRESSEWTDLWFGAINPDEDMPEDWKSLAPLQAVESDYLDAIGVSTGSPYLYRLTAEEE
jgi:hypothetical protein